MKVLQKNPVLQSANIIRQVASAVQSIIPVTSRTKIIVIWLSILSFTFLWKLTKHSFPQTLFSNQFALVQLLKCW